METVTLLEREMYSEQEAARLLNVAPSTLHYWLEGKQGRKDKVYKPVIRPEPKGKDAAVTWAEFVEAGLLREYRRSLGVRMADLRHFIERLRQDFGVPYPLADRRPFVSGREIVLTAQQATGLPGELWLVTSAADQLLLTPASESFLRRAQWEGDAPVAWHPADEDSPVLIDPDIRFGRPSINGISTAVIWEHADDGESDDEIAQSFGLNRADVVWALAYEKPRRLPVEAKSA
jgi:uncharacterized protein (DUF433 family)